MSKPINLNRVRKARAKAEKRARADANAAKFGQSKADKARSAAEAERAGRQHDAHKRED